MRLGRRSLPQERGTVLVFLAILLPVILSIGALVISVGNWFTHGKHLQTKVDAAALAGGGAWSFPCSPDSDASIAAAARQYVGDHTAADSSLVTGSFNPQVGGVGGSDIYVVLNQADWWDGSFTDVDFTDPSGSVCQSITLDVKATEDDSPPLWGWLPLWPDIKRKARVEIRQIFGITRPLPIAVRVPKPTSVAAVFYNEANGAILAARYFRADDSVPGLPAGLGGWTTRPDDSEQWPQFMPATSTGVLIATSFLPKCPRTPQCFEIDTGTYPTVNSLCNQGPAEQTVRCFDASGSTPSVSAESGLHFIRGYADTNPGTGPPGLESSYLTNISCPSGGAYFSSHPTIGCQVKLHVALNLGALQGTYPNPPNPPVTEALHAGDVEVRYRLVRADGTSSCDYGTQCDLIGSGSGPNITFSTQGGSGSSPHLPIAAGSGGNAVAIQVRIRNAVNSPNPDCRGGTFKNNCRWFYTGTGVPSPSVEPTEAAILAAPVQRSYLGNLDRSGPVYWLRLSADPDCDPTNGYLEEPLNPEAASRKTATCFAIDMGLKGGLAKDQDEFAFAFNEGTGSSQMGSLDCDPSIPQGQMLIDGVQFGCSPWYRKNSFDSSPLCPDANSLFDDPNPGPPFDDWPPLECVKTRPTGSMNQLIEGLNLRLFGDGTNPQCPVEVDPTKFYPGRNYWHNANNQNDSWTFYDDRGTPTTADDLRNRINPDDPRLVYLFFTPYNTFTGSGQEVFPLTGLGAFYIAGYGRLNGSGGFQGGEPDDPCDDGNVGALDGYPAGVGNEPPPDLIDCGGSCSGTVVWGHFLLAVDSSGGSTPSEEPCDPDESFTPCRPVLVE